jgi:hypothetical protein
MTSTFRAHFRFAIFSPKIGPPRLREINSSCVSGDDSENGSGECGYFHQQRHRKVLESGFLCIHEIVASKLGNIV